MPRGDWGFEGSVHPLLNQAPNKFVRNIVGGVLAQPLGVQFGVFLMGQRLPAFFCHDVYLSDRRRAHAAFEGLGGGS